jgi:hypothetical protein
MNTIIRTTIQATREQRKEKKQRKEASRQRTGFTRRPQVANSHLVQGVYRTLALRRRLENHEAHDGQLFPMVFLPCQEQGQTRKGGGRRHVLRRREYFRQLGQACCKATAHRFRHHSELHMCSMLVINDISCSLRSHETLHPTIRSHEILHPTDRSRETLHPTDKLHHCLGLIKENRRRLLYWRWVNFVMLSFYNDTLTSHISPQVKNPLWVVQSHWSVDTTC